RERESCLRQRVSEGEKPVDGEPQHRACGGCGADAFERGRGIESCLAVEANPQAFADRPADGDHRDAKDKKPDRPHHLLVPMILRRSFPTSFLMNSGEKSLPASFPP